MASAQFLIFFTASYCRLTAELTVLSGVLENPRTFLFAALPDWLQSNKPQADMSDLSDTLVYLVVCQSRACAAGR